MDLAREGRSQSSQTDKKTLILGSFSIYIKYVLHIAVQHVLNTCTCDFSDEGVDHCLCARCTTYILFHYQNNFWHKPHFSTE